MTGLNRSATAFCVHESGLFITSCHAIDGQPGELKIVIHSGTDAQRVLAAKAVRRDPGIDLALLKVDNAGEYPKLALGSDDRLEELLEVFVFGFPFGKAPGNPSGEFPSISVNLGTVSSLRRVNSAITEIRLNAAVNPGNSGGPILDAQARVLGVVRGRIEAQVGAGIDIAVPVNVLRRFLDRPEVTLQASQVRGIQPGQKVDFEASVLDAIPRSTAPDLELVLGMGTPAEQRVRMTASSNVYRAQAVPIPESQGPKRVQTLVEFADGAVRGNVEDCEIRVGEKSIKLSQLSVVRLAPRLEVIDAGGKALQGTPGLPGELTVSVDGQTLRLNLKRALVLNLTHDEGDAIVTCKLLQKQDGQEISIADLDLLRADVPLPSFDALRAGRFIRPPRVQLPVSYLRMESQPGDFIGQGKSYAYEKSELSFMPVPGGLQCQVAPVGNWTVVFASGARRNLESGEYRDARRHPFHGDSPGLAISGNGRGCNMLAGEFQIWELELQGNMVVRLAIDFIQRCEGSQPPLVGMLRYNSKFY